MRGPCPICLVKWMCMTEYKNLACHLIDVNGEEGKRKLRELVKDQEREESLIIQAQLEEERI